MCESCLLDFYQDICHNPVSDQCQYHDALFSAEDSPEELNFEEEYLAFMEDNFSDTYFPSFTIYS